MKADLTVLIPNYNGMPYLKDAILSISRSSVLPKIVIILDNGSTDTSLEYLNSLNFDKFLIKVVRIETKGTGYALNEGIKHIDTEYVMRMDSDDLILEEKIAKQLDAFSKDENLFIVGTNAFYFIEYTNNVLHSTSTPIAHDEILKSYSQGFHGMFDGTIMFKNDPIVKQCFYSEVLQTGNEFSFHLDLIKKNNLKALNLSEKLYFIRLHDLSTTDVSMLNDFQKIFLIRNRYFNRNTFIYEKFCAYRLFVHHKLWRMVLFAKNNSKIKYYLVLICLAILFPSKVMKRLF